MDKPVIVIGGGVGPMAGVVFHKNIVKYTTDVKKDADHLDVWHVSDVKEMPDRTGFLSGKTKENPANLMAKNMLEIGRIISSRGKNWVSVIPCATFHSKEIYGSYAKKIRQSPGFLKDFHFIETLANELAHNENFENPSRIAVLSTQGSYRSGAWYSAIEKKNHIVVDVPEEVKSRSHELIYSESYGIKSCFPVTQTAFHEFYHLLSFCEKLGVDAVLLGCTEYSVLWDSRDASINSSQSFPLVIDPFEIVAKAVVSEVIAARGMNKSN